MRWLSWTRIWPRGPDVFLTGLVVSDDARPRMWVVLEPLVWEDAQFGRITVPVGFLTDFASVPPIVRDIPTFDPNGASRKAAALHDWNYTWHGLDKDHADELLRQSLLVSGISRLTADVFYDAVQEFGLPAWNAHIGGPAQDRFDTAENFHQWLASASPVFSTTVPGVLI